MNTKEAIEFIEYILTIAGEHYDEDSQEKKNQVISLLQQGEKYKQMWRELKERYPSLVLNYISNDAKIFLTQARVLRRVEMEALEQKYFPDKPKKKGDLNNGSGKSNRIYKKE